MKLLGAAMVFAAELGMLAGLAAFIWGRLHGVLGALFAAGACLAVAVVWGAFLSPRARWRISSFGLVTAVRLAILLTGAAAAWFAGIEWLAVATALLATIGAALAGRTVTSAG